MRILKETWQKMMGRGDIWEVWEGNRMICQTRVQSVAWEEYYSRLGEYNTIDNKTKPIILNYNLSN